MAKTLTSLLHSNFKLSTEKLSDFAQELKKLTPEDRAFFKAEFEKMGEEIKEE